MRQSNAATGGWSRFETKTAALAGMAAILTEFLIAERKDRAAAWAR